MNKENIVLIGFMGSGKSTLGRWISKEHGYEFIDTDDYIVEQEKRSINDIFASDGEEYFRNLETDAVRHLSQDERKLVVSVGGGLPMREENRRILKSLGRVVYLSTDVDELVRRLNKDTTRPLLSGGDIREKITSLMEKREAIYREAADIVVDTTGKGFRQIYDEIVKF